MTELKRQKNEAQVEKDLHIQYMDRMILGTQSCEDRLHKKKETELEKEIENLHSVLATEREVNDAVAKHLKERVVLLNEKYKAQEAKREAHSKEIDMQKQEIKDRKAKALEEMQEITDAITKDKEERRKREEENEEEEQKQEAKIREKMSMDDAARYIQRRWHWFQTEGKFLAKKGKKGRKGKKKKKK